MKQMNMRILGIETACDDTAAAVVENGLTVESNVIASQHRHHAQHRGIVPELAARSHTHQIIPTIEQALREANRSLADIDAIAVNNQRGLLRSLVVGLAAAKGIARAMNKPLYAVHHIEGHIYSALMTPNPPEMPYLCLTVAGGHNYLVLVQGIGKYLLVAHTLDDAAGETLDKIAVMLGLGFPGGPALEKLATNGDPSRFALPRPLLAKDIDAFSFSGLKTAVRRLVSSFTPDELLLQRADIAASAQQAVVDCLVGKTIKVATRIGCNSIALTGGVAANTRLRTSLDVAASEINARLTCALPKLCTDNAAMIAGLGYHYALAGKTAGFETEAFPDKELISWAS